MSVGLFAGCSSDSGDNSSDNTDSGGTKDSIVIATSGETPSLSPTEHNAVAPGAAVTPAQAAIRD